jgi:hypothetical protein
VFDNPARDANNFRKIGQQNARQWRIIMNKTEGEFFNSPSVLHRNVC